MTDRQKTGVWFVVTGILLLSIWIFSDAIVNTMINAMPDLFAPGTRYFTNEQQYVIGASGVFALRLTSVTGIPLIITGLAQIITGMQKAKKSSRK
jgi:predicted phage tail protein